jgi:hypothetical protein
MNRLMKERSIQAGIMVSRVSRHGYEVYKPSSCSTIQNSKLEKEREKEEVGGRYLSTRSFACTSVAQANTRPRYLRLRTMTESWYLQSSAIDRARFIGSCYVDENGHVNFS